ncbi:hypothetical protein CY652_10790 [Burkholderia sp. WAC0059]|nr:hypothetical protein CY652_10790 [Burkholderia sp. WAC0059]
MTAGAVGVATMRDGLAEACVLGVLAVREHGMDRGPGSLDAGRVHAAARADARRARAVVPAPAT